jgi:hypothetical protein
MKRVLLLFPWVISTAVATSVTLADSPDWHSLPDEQAAPIRKSLPMETKEISTNPEAGTSAILVEIPTPEKSNTSSQLWQRRVNAVAGAKASVTETGYYTVSTEGGTSFGPLPGAYLVFTSPNPDERPHILILMGFAHDKSYSVYFYSRENPAKLSVDIPFVKSYLSRMSFSDVDLSEKSANAAPENSAYKIGWMVGYIIVPLGLVAFGMGLSFLCYWLFRQKPHPDSSETT